MLAVAMGVQANPDEVFASLQRAGIAPQAVSLVAQPVDGDAPALFAHNDQNPMTLASTTKLATTLAALDVLGPRFRWQTRAFALGDVRDGVLVGDLLLVGGGDPRLGSDELRQWFTRLRAKGLYRIEGHIVLNRGLFQTQASDHLSTPIPTAENPHHGWPDALAIDEGTLTVELKATPQGPVLSYQPRLEGVNIVNALRVMPRKCASLREPVTAVFQELSDPPRILVQGDWAPGCGPSRWLIATLPGSFFSPLAVEAAWRDAGGELGGGVLQHGDAYMPPQWPRGQRPYAVLESPPLRQVLRDMNKWSNNLMARHVMLSLAKGFPGRPATPQEARKRFNEWLQRQGVAPGDLVLDNGSGLSHGERGRPAVLLHLLRQAWKGPHKDDLLASLPVAGEDGTLATRFKEPEVRGKAFLKTGTLIGTRSLAGYVLARSGRTYAVVAVINDPRADKGVAALDAFVAWVVANG